MEFPRISRRTFGIDPFNPSPKILKIVDIGVPAGPHPGAGLLEHSGKFDSAVQ